MTSYAKIGNAWGIRTSVNHLPGTTITVITRAGKEKQVTLGEKIGQQRGDFLFAIAPAPAAPAQEVGDLARIIAMFDRARQHLRYPAIVLDGFRVSVAGDRAREPGSLTITSVDRDYEGKRAWYGRVSLTGMFSVGRNAPADLGAKLRAFAADPAGQAAAYGHLHGACCFCNRALTDDRSTAVGYGPICADHFDLPWGTAAAA